MDGLASSNKSAGPWGVEIIGGGTAGDCVVEVAVAQDARDGCTICNRSAGDGVAVMTVPDVRAGYTICKRSAGDGAVVITVPGVRDGYTICKGSAGGRRSGGTGSRNGVRNGE